jgi:hypothetical protein
MDQERMKVQAWMEKQQIGLDLPVRVQLKIDGEVFWFSLKIGLDFANRIENDPIVSAYTPHWAPWQLRCTRHFLLCVPKPEDGA